MIEADTGTFRTIVLVKSRSKTGANSSGNCVPNSCATGLLCSSAARRPSNSIAPLTEQSPPVSAHTRVNYRMYGRQVVAAASLKPYPTIARNKPPHYHTICDPL